MDGRKMLSAIVLLVLVATACATSPKKMNEGLDPWIGQDSSALVRSWGPPSSVFTDPSDGNRIYTWFYQGATVTTFIPVLSMAVTDTSDFCKIDFYTNPSGQITNIRWAGSCKLKFNK